MLNTKYNIKSILNIEAVTDVLEDRGDVNSVFYALALRIDYMVILEVEDGLPFIFS